ncbi:MAG TPA: hypothetical protein DEB10_12030 [Ruminococcaceae bacterium]|jgi:serine kinase of HPr protein (carbohydrate metabolism regulator)|nr:hypothetical protein [Oscillospiraceae bacterium]
MTVTELVKRLNLEILVEGDGSREVTGGYAGDLLSWVMGRAREGDAWITVMGNLNAIAVAVLADTACIILPEDAALDKDARERAVTEGIPILRSSETSFQLAVKIDRLLHN